MTAATPVETSRERFAAAPHETGGPYEIQEFERVEEGAKIALEKVARNLEGLGLVCRSVVAFGNPAEEIAEVAEREGCDLIAVSTHGRNSLGRGILGSVTDKVIHSAHIPTVTLTPDKAQGYGEENVKFYKVIVPLDGS